MYINNAEENTFIENMVKQQTTSSTQVWIGGSDAHTEGVWRVARVRTRARASTHARDVRTVVPSAVRNAEALAAARARWRAGTFEWFGGWDSKGTVFYENNAAVEGMYVNWAPGEPNDANGNADCAIMMVGPGSQNGQWADEDCYKTKEYFIVEFDV